MSDAVRCAEIQRYVQKAFLAKIMQMNDVRQKKALELRSELGRHGHSMNSSAWMIGEVEIEEDCIADLLRQKAGLYIDAYGRVGLRIGPEILKDLAHSQVELTAARKSSLIGSAQLTATRTNRPQNMTIYGHLGRKASVAMKEIEARIDLYNLSHPAVPAGGPWPIENGKERHNQEKPLAEPVASDQSNGTYDGQRHEGKSGRPSAPSASGSPSKETIWTKMWSWVVVGAIDLFVLAGGIAFMTSGHVWAADGFFVGGTALFLAKFWTWEDARRQPPPRKWALQAAVTMLSLGLALGAILWNHAINYPPAVIQSRQSPTQPGRSASQTGQPAGGKTQAAKSDSRKITGESIPTDESTTEEQTITTSERVKVIIARQLQVDASQVKDSDDFEMDLGADPGDVYFLMRSLELEYNITIPDRDSKNLHTVGETIDYIERREHEKR